MADVYMIDPPWPKLKGGLRAARPNQSRPLEYQTMSVAEIFQLLDRDIFPTGDANHIVFMWTVDEFLHECESSMKARGYRMHARMVWDKGNGVAPAFSVRYCHEYLIWFYKPKFTPVATESRGKISTVIREGARQHSRKPDAAYSIINQWFPSLEKMDVFSREKREGWSQYGNQCDHFTPEMLS